MAMHPPQPGCRQPWERLAARVTAGERQVRLPSTVAARQDGQDQGRVRVTAAPDAELPATESARIDPEEPSCISLGPAKHMPSFC